MKRGHKKGSGERSNMYSEDKYSNWSRFDPYHYETDKDYSRVKPVLVYEVDDDTQISITQNQLHKSFVAPVTPKEVHDILKKIPNDFLVDLEGVHILGGTAKQDKVAFGRLFKYGCYGGNRIYLSAFPSRLLTQYYQKLPKPDVMNEYKRVGANFTQNKKGWVFNFTNDSLQRFYLFDVLLHEVGHHVDRSNLPQKNTKACERFAEWFTVFCEKEVNK